jgi:hypothetical protein
MEPNDIQSHSADDKELMPSRFVALFPIRSTIHEATIMDTSTGEKIGDISDVVWARMIVMLLNEAHEEFREPGQ